MIPGRERRIRKSYIALLPLSYNYEEIESGPQKIDNPEDDSGYVHRLISILALVHSITTPWI